MSRVVHIGFAVIFSAALVTLGGCDGKGYEGPQRAEVSGNVTYEGTPITEGSINLIPIGDGRQIGVSILDGAYLFSETDGPTFGKYKVEIMAFEFEEAGGEEGEEEEEGGSTQIIPPKYNTETTLELDVSEAKVLKDFDLTAE